MPRHSLGWFGFGLESTMKYQGLGLGLGLEWRLISGLGLSKGGRYK
jgi:hypothetical protein